MAALRPQYEVFLSERDGRFYWRLRARNGEIVAHSEGYTRKDAAIAGAKSARSAGRFARLEVLS